MPPSSTSDGTSIRLSPDAALALLHRFAPVMDFLGPHNSTAGEAVAAPRPPSTDSLPALSTPPSSRSHSVTDTDESIDGQSAGEPNLRPIIPLSQDTMRVFDDNVPGECSMEQYICFVYRGKSIWLRITVLMEDNGSGQAIPHVEVRFMTQTHDDDPAFRRIGLVIERELQDGMRREILSAIQQAVNLQYVESD